MWWLRLLYFLGVAPDRLAQLYRSPVASGSTTVMIFAKAPVPGTVKTRLIPALGSAGAAQLALRMLQNALKVAADARLGPVQLHCAPNAGHAVLRAAAARAGATCLAQGRGDLGERMQSALPRRCRLRRGRCFWEQIVRRLTKQFCAKPTPRLHRVPGRCLRADRGWRFRTCRLSTRSAYFD
jgi:hypothetical protein